MSPYMKILFIESAEEAREIANSDEVKALPQDEQIRIHAVVESRFGPDMSMSAILERIEGKDSRN